MATRTEIQAELERALAELEADAGSLTAEQLERRCTESEVPGAAGHRSLPRQDLRELAAMGISLDRAATALQTEGVNAFARSYEEFLSSRRLAASSGAAGQDPG
jgi:hypothetical protein